MRLEEDRQQERRKLRPRVLRLEPLEARRLLAVDWRNPVHSLDVNADGFLAPVDVLEVINDLNAVGARGLPATRPAGQPYWDTSGDQFISPVDALQAINALNDGQTLPVVLAERQQIVVEQSITITVGLPQDQSSQAPGTRTYRLEVAAGFDRSDGASASRDLFAIYLVDPQQPSTTLLDRGLPGTTLFTLTEAGAEFATGRARWDGQVVELDLSELTDRDTAELRLQLLSNDSDHGSNVVVRPLSNEVDATGRLGPRLLDTIAASTAGAALNLTSLAAQEGIAVQVENVRYDSTTRRYAAELRLQNAGESAGRGVAVAFPGLPSGVTLRAASGTTGDGAPYVNFAPALDRGGLSKNARSEPLLVEIDNPARLPFTLAPQVLAAANRAPTLDPLPPLTVTPGDVLRVPLVANDPDGDRVTFSLGATGAASASFPNLPTSTLHADGTLEFRPIPSQLGTYTFDVIATDGDLSTRHTATIDVVADSNTTTRISGRVLKTTQEPLTGVLIEVGPVSAITATDGSFTLDFGVMPPVSDTLKVRAELLPGPEQYPFIAEKLEYMLGREVYAGVNNVITRPIWLPVLDLANAQQIDPMQDTTVTTAAVPGLELFIKAGTLMNQQGTPYSGLLSITQVPVDLTPAALPEGLILPLVVTIQPGEMVFTQPAPITFPNTAGWGPGTLVPLWSINPVTGEFEVVGDMRVSADGSRIETISGGVRTSSWHGPDGPPPPPVQDEDDPEPCEDECEEGGAGGSEIKLHSGALIETHDLVTYQSLGQTRGLTLTYDSLRADPRHIVHIAYENIDATAFTGGFPERLRLMAIVDVFRGNLHVRAPGAPAGEFLLIGGENTWSLPATVGDVDAALQVDLRTLPTGRYDTSISSGLRIQSDFNDPFTGTMLKRSGSILHVNSIASPFGAGWGIDGLAQLIENPDGSLLYVDGDGTEMLFMNPVRQVRDLLIQDATNKAVLRYDGVTGALIGPFITRGTGGLDAPHNPTFGPDGNLYVISGGTREVLRYDGETGAFIDVFVSDGAGGFAGAAELAFDSADNLYAATVGALGVLRYDSAGNFIDSIAGPGDGVQAACGVEFGPDGNLYVWDTLDEELRRFDPATGNLIDVLIASSSNVVNACDFDIGPDGDIFITDATLGGVRRFDGATGAFLGVFAATSSTGASGVTFGPDGNLYVNVNGNTDRFDGRTGAFIDRFVPGNAGFVNFFPGTAPQGATVYDSPGGDFSALEKRADGTFRRTMPDQTVHEYDAAGRLARMTDRNGNVTAWEYDEAGLLTRVVDPVGLATTLAYVGGKLTSVTDPAGRVTQFQFDAAGNLTRVTDPDGSQRNFEYDGDHHMTAEVDPRGHREQAFYDFAGRVDRTIRKDGSIIDVSPVQVHGLYPPEATIDPFNAPLVFGDLTSESTYVDGNGNTIVTTLDRRGQKLFAIDPVDALPVSEFDPATNLVTKVTDARGNVTNYTYDARGNLTSVTDSINATNPIQFTYDPTFSQLTSIIDELGHPTLFDIDPVNGNTRSRTRVIGTPGGGDDLVTQLTYTARGELDTLIDPLGRVTDYDYDAAGRLIRVQFAVGTVDESTRQFEYDMGGNTTAIIDENGNRTAFQYDSLNRVTRVTEADPDGAGPLVSPVTRMTYDPSGNLTSMTDARGNVTQFEYDVLNRRSRAIDALGQISAFTYDNADNLVSISDPLLHVTRLVYDERRRLIEWIDPDAGLTRFRYDQDDNLVGVTDPAGNTTRFAYDARNRLVLMFDQSARSAIYDYDLADNLIAMTDWLGRVTEFTYDDADRLVSEGWVTGGNTINFSYDLASNLLTAGDRFSSLAFTYDARNRVTSADNFGTPNVPRVVLDYSYDDVGNTLSVADTIAGDAGGVNSYQYDALNRLARLTQTGSDASDKRVDFRYDPLGQLDSIERFSDLAGTQSVASSAYSYDVLNRLTSLAHAGSAGLLDFFNFTFDAASRITRIVNADGTTDYAYDSRDELTRATHSDAANPDELYAYDANGNRTTATTRGATVDYQTERNNQLTSDGTFNYDYDSERNLILRTEIATGATRAFTWDFRNRLTAVIDHDAGGVETQRVEFTYDAFNRRISKNVVAAGNAELTHFVYDQDNVLLDFIDSDGAAGPTPAVLDQRYLHGPAVDQVLAQDGGADGVLWMLTDHLGTVTDLADSMGTAVSHFKYDSYGNIISESNAAAATRYRFTGREFDAETELYYYRARYYDAALGRFLSEDPIDFGSGDTNLYRYVGNTPTGYRDPAGLQGLTQFRFGGFFDWLKRFQPHRDQKKQKPSCQDDSGDTDEDEDDREQREPGGGGGGPVSKDKRRYDTDVGAGGFDIITVRLPSRGQSNRRNDVITELRQQTDGAMARRIVGDMSKMGAVLNIQSGIQGFFIEE